MPAAQLGAVCAAHAVHTLCVLRTLCCRYVKFDTYHPAASHGLPVTRVICRHSLQVRLGRGREGRGTAGRGGLGGACRKQCRASGAASELWGGQ